MKKTVIITGANSGLGFETAKRIAADPVFQIILACRNSEKAEYAAAKIEEETGNHHVLCMDLDTASLESVRRFEMAYNSKGYGKVYALLCNAGINGLHRGMTADGFDIVFETNHLGHFMLTNLFLPHMEASGRIFVTSSDMHNAPMKKMTWTGTETLAHPTSDFGEDSIRYSYSKLCNLYFVYELSERLGKQGSRICVNAFNPGLMKTNFMTLTKASMEFVKRTMPKRYGDLEQSSCALAELVASGDLVKESGLYYDRSIFPCPSSELSYNKENAEELWEASENYIREWYAARQNGRS